MKKSIALLVLFVIIGCDEPTTWVDKVEDIEITYANKMIDTLYSITDYTHTFGPNVYTDMYGEDFYVNEDYVMRTRVIAFIGKRYTFRASDLKVDSVKFRSAK